MGNVFGMQVSWLFYLQQLAFGLITGCIYIDKRNTPPSKHINSPQHPLQMPIRHPRLEFGLHVSTQIRLRPHQPTLVMLHAHGALRPVDSTVTVGVKHTRVFQIDFGDDNRRVRLRLEAQLAVPCHVLDGHEGTVRDDDHVEVAVGDEHAVRGFDDLREDVLDRIGREIAFAFGAAVVVAVDFDTADDDGVDGTFGPVDVRRRVDGSFDVRAVEVGHGAFGGVDELGGEGEDVPEERALLVDFVDVEAGVVLQGGVVDHIEDVAVGFAGVVEKHGWLVSGRWEGEVFFSVFGIAAGLVKTFELGEERVVELEEGLIFQNEGYGRDLFLCVVELANARVVD